jgi:phenylalanyl-tRNA synthetase alpha chain
MTQNIAQLKEELSGLIAAANDLQKLEEARVTALGKKGRITDLMKALGQMAPEERKDFGAAVNALKDEMTDLIAHQECVLKKQAMTEKLAAERMDVTLPLRPEQKGTIHPVSQTMEELVAIFGSMGFELAEGPDIEDDWHNFTALNFPPGHPAREMHDTFYLPNDAGKDGEEGRRLLRTHTSTVQIRYMTGRKPPFKMICMGRTYRSDYDMTHTPVFHQIEGLVIDKAIHMGHLKGCLMDFLGAFFGVQNLPIRMRPSFFPFTEPSAEFDMGCSRGKGELKIGEGSDWIEMGGSGMVHPNVLKNCGIDPEEYQGFAFGLGIERLAMLKYGIPDLRTFFESDTRWLSHYGFDPLDRPNVTNGTKG